MKRSNQSMKPTAPLQCDGQRVCHDTLPWLISFSLDEWRPSRPLRFARPPVLHQGRQPFALGLAFADPFIAIGIDKMGLL
jgi:hypothetical protein